MILAAEGGAVANEGKLASAWVLAIAVALVAVAYGGALSGGFVFDDNKQITANPYIQDPRNLGTALTSDVWSFEGSADAPSSSYWRPLFVAWLTAGWAFFGASTRLWHASNLVLHLAATCLAFFMLRSAGATVASAAVACWIFAVHPVHVESVAWVSGSPDLLLAMFLFASFVAHARARSSGSRAAELLALALFALALLCKELAVVFPILLLWSDRVAEPARGGASWKRSLRAVGPYVLTVAAYLIARTAVLGTRARPIAGATDLLASVLSAPSAVLFYLRQVAWPFGLGPSHEFVPVTIRTLGLSSFVLPLATVALLAACWVRLARRRAVAAVALAWFLLPLLPPLDLRHFIPEDLVHDRYLYLPLVGLAALAGEGITLLHERSRSPWLRARPAAAWIAGLAIALALVPVTRAYVPTWRNDVELWKRAVETNPSVAYPHGQLGEAYRKAGRLEEARAELERALALNPGLKAAHAALGSLAAAEGKLPEAEQHLRLVLDARPNDRGALEQMALVYQKQGKLDDAIALFERGRSNLPARWAAYTVNVAVLERMAGRPENAVAVLRSLGDRLTTSKDPAVLRAYWFLGELERERGRAESAIASYQAYISAAAGIDDPAVARLRESAAARIHELTGAPKAP